MTPGPIPSSAPSFQPDASQPAGKPPAVRAWQAATSGSGLLLALTFFLPAVVDGCSKKPDIPAAHWAGLIREHNYSLGGIAGALFLYGLAYLLGGVMAGGALARLTDHPRWARAGARCTAALILVACAMVFSSYHEPGSFMPSFHWDTSLLLLPIALATLVLLGLSWRRKERAYLGYCLIGSVLVVAWFGFWIATQQPLYGIYLSLLGSLGLLISTLGESRAGREAT